MLWTPRKGAVQFQHNFGSVGSTTPGAGLSITAAGGKSAAVEVFASLNFDAYWVSIMAFNYGLNATNTRLAVDLLGGAATEEVLIADILMGNTMDLDALAPGCRVMHFPLYIPAGTRIAVRGEGARTATANIVVFAYGGAEPLFRPAGKITTYGITGAATGTAITPGATGVEGAYAQITAATSVDHFGLQASFQSGDAAITPVGGYWVDVGMGAATEELVIESQLYTKHGDEMIGGPYPGMPAFLDIPSGTRLAMRASSNVGIDSPMDGAVYAFS